MLLKANIRDLLCNKNKNDKPRVIKVGNHSKNH